MKFVIVGMIASQNSLDLEKEILNRGHEVVKIKLKNLIFKVQDNSFKIFCDGYNLKDFDIFIFRGYNKNNLEAGILAEKLLSFGKVVIDERVGTVFMENKLLEARELSGVGINYPDSYYALDVSSFDKIKGEIYFPVIVKPIDGVQGINIYKFENPEQLKDFFKARKSPKGWLIQEKLEIDGDVRVFVVGNKVLGAMKRFIIEGDYRSNVSLGAKVEKFKLTKEVEELAVNSAKTMGIEIAGVDLAYSNGKWYVIEVNATPQWQGFKKATGVNPAESIVQLAIEKNGKK